MKNRIKSCIDRQLAPVESLEASRRAIKETTENVPTARYSSLPGVYDPSPAELAVLTGKKWRTGRTIDVGFLGGSSTLRTKVEAVAKRWEDYANLTLSFGDHDRPDIRIDFIPGGSWSYLGTDALVLPDAEATMNYGWLTPDSSDDEIGRVVLHEFGHALSAIHEHQSPAANIPWDREAVYEYYGSQPNSWSKEQIDRNIFNKYSTTIANSSAFDAESIMLYAIPNALTEGDYEVGWNRVLSDTDKTFMGSIYPGSAPAPTQLTVRPSREVAAIGEHGEIDLFRFDVEQDGQYIVETFGSTDVVMSVLGPNDEATLVAEDDDSGGATNARVTATLTTGDYLVRVRHYSPGGTGDYEIAVRKAG